MSVPASMLGIILIWSTTPLAIQWSSEEVGFLFGLAARMLLGLMVCLALVWVLRLPFKWDRPARLTYLSSGMGLYGAMLCVYWGGQYISSGLMSVVYGLLPMATYLCAVLWLREPLWQPAKLLGVAFGIAGLAVIFQPGDAFSVITAMGIVGVLASVGIHAVSMVWVKRIGADISALSVTSGGLLFAVPLYLITWWLIDGQLPAVMSDKTISAIIYLGLMGSVVGFVLFYYVLKRVNAGAIALLTLVTPVLALLIGHQLNNETTPPEVLIGAMLILTGLATHSWGGKMFPAKS